MDWDVFLALPNIPRREERLDFGEGLGEVEGEVASSSEG